MSYANINILLNTYFYFNKKLQIMNNSVNEVQYLQCNTDIYEKSLCEIPFGMMV